MIGLQGEPEGDPHDQAAYRFQDPMAFFYRPLPIRYVFEDMRGKNQVEMLIWEWQRIRSIHSHDPFGKLFGVVAVDPALLDVRTATKIEVHRRSAPQ